MKITTSHFFLFVNVLPLALSAQTIEVTSAGAGMGTSSPATSLHVVGPFTAGYMQCTVQASGSDNRAGISFLSSSGSRSGAFYVEPSGDFIFSRDQSGQFRFFSNGSERLTIAADGKVGIGTTSPANTLHVVSQAKFGLNDTSVNNYGGILVASGTGVGGARQYWIGASNPASHNNNNFVISDYNGSTNSPLLTILGTHNGSAGGNVGIGTTSPQAGLHVYNSGGHIAMFQTNQTGAGIRDIAFADSTGSVRVMVGYDPSLDAFQIGDTSGITITSKAGNVGIGTTSPSYPLHVSGSVRATSFISNSTTYADFVFKPGYHLAPLSEVEAAIKEHGHLPEIPSEAEAKAHGVDLAKMQTKLLQKVEELTLYLVNHEKELNQLQAENETLRRRVSELERR